LLQNNKNMEKSFVVNLRKQHEEEIALYEFLKNPDKSLFVTTENIVGELINRLNSKNVIGYERFIKLGGHEIHRYNGNEISRIIFYTIEDFCDINAIRRKIFYLEDFSDIYIFYGAEPIEYNVFKYIKENTLIKTKEQMIAEYPYYHIPHLKIANDFELMTNPNINLIIV